MIGMCSYDFSGFVNLGAWLDFHHASPLFKRVHRAFFVELKKFNK
jgi:hypothetical protein